MYNESVMFALLLYAAYHRYLADLAETEGHSVADLKRKFEAPVSPVTVDKPKPGVGRSESFRVSCALFHYHNYSVSYCAFTSVSPLRR